jgi:hypothetical protein
MAPAQQRGREARRGGKDGNGRTRVLAPVVPERARGTRQPPRGDAADAGAARQKCVTAGGLAERA